MRGTRQNMPEVHEVRKSDLYKKKFVVTRGIKQNVLKVCKLGKLILFKKTYHDERHKKNMPEMWRSGSLTPTST